MSRQPKLRNVLAYDAHIDSTRYVKRWGQRPDAIRGVSEYWLVMDKQQIGFVLCYHGTYSQLVRKLDRSFVGGAPRWILYAPHQAIFNNPKGHVTELGKVRSR